MKNYKQFKNKNNMGFNYGAKAQRNLKEEKYNFPVLTQQVKGDKGTVSKSVLNIKALEALGYDKDNLKEAKISVALLDKELVIVNTTGDVTDGQSNVNNNHSFNNKKFFELLEKHLDVDTSVENEFRLTILEEEGIKYATLQQIVDEVEEIVPEVEDDMGTVPYAELEEDPIMKSKPTNPPSSGSDWPIG